MTGFTPSIAMFLFTLSEFVAPGAGKFDHIFPATSFLMAEIYKRKSLLIQLKSEYCPLFNHN